MIAWLREQNARHVTFIDAWQGGLPEWLAQAVSLNFAKWEAGACVGLELKATASISPSPQLFGPRITCLKMQPTWQEP